MMLSMMLENGETQQNLQPVVIQQTPPSPVVVATVTNPEPPVEDTDPDTPIQRPPKQPVGSTPSLGAPPKKHRRSKLKMKDSSDKVFDRIVNSIW